MILHWVKSSLSFSNGNCIEVAWRKAAASGSNGQCVEVSGTGAAILVRNSRHPDGAVLEFTLEEWAAFVGGAKLGEFDRFGA